MSPADPIFSIVMPAYNRADLVGHAIRSVLGQTFDAYEVIVVDDGSTDATRDEVMKFSDPRIRYFYKQNEERSIARNYGIAKARGQYISFLDSDDYLYPHHLQTAETNLRDKGFPEILHVGYEIKNFDGKTLLIRADFGDSINRQLIEENILHCNSIFIRREALAQVSFISSRDAILAEDMCLWLRLAARYRIHCVNTVTNVVCEHTDRSLNKLVPEKVERSLLLILKTLEADPVFMQYYGKRYYRFKAKKCCFIALSYVMRGDKTIAARYLKRAAQCYPAIVFYKSFLAVLKKIVLQ
jgi:glycosyltransferase involved in cell wall biosynthesis